jgi:predicted nucleic acid-binding protein
MILVDSCVIFDYTRGKDIRLLDHSRSLPVGICGITRAEVLHGARSISHRAKLLALLNYFAQVRTAETIWDVVGDNLAALRQSGITVPIQDVILTSIAIEGGYEVWSRDAHFTAIQRFLPNLRLFQEP